MKVKMFALHNSVSALSELSGKPIPAVSAFKVAMLVKAINEPLAAFDETKNTLLKEVGEEQADKPGEYKINDMQRWQAEITALLDQEVDLSVPPIKVSELNNVSVEPRHLLALEWCLEA